MRPVTHGPDVANVEGHPTGHEPDGPNPAGHGLDEATYHVDIESGL